MSRSIVTHSLPALLVLLLGAVVLIVAGSSTTGFAVGLAAVGVAGVLLVSTFFYEVGRSEDRDRARERRRYRGPHARGL